jgi:hypothetical protein
MRVREDMIRRRDGSSGIYGVVEKPDFVVIVPVGDDALRPQSSCAFSNQIGHWSHQRGRWFESGSLQRRVCKPSVPRANAARPAISFCNLEKRHEGCRT